MSFNILKISFIAVLLLFISCNKKEKQKLRTEIKKLEDESKNYRSKILEATDTKEKNKEKTSAVKGILKLEEENKFIKENIHKTYKPFLNKKTFFYSLCDNLNLNEYSFIRMLNNYSKVHNAFDIEPATKYPYNILTSYNVLFDRSSENIQAFFNDETIDIIISFFDNNNYYEDSGASYYFRALLIAYDETNDKKLLDDLYTSNTTFSYWSEESIALLNEIKSDKVDNALIAYNFSTYESDYDKNNKDERSYLVLDIYSFWARRYHEKNIKEVYEILKEVHNRLKK